MFAGRFSSSIGMVGIDFGSRGVKMLQVRQQGGDLRVVGAARIDVPLPRVAGAAEPAAAQGSLNEQQQRAANRPAGDDDVESAAAPASPDYRIFGELVREAFAAGGFSGRKCVVSLAREDVCVQSIRLPKMPDAELRQSAVWEASQRFHFDRGSMEVDFIRTGATLASGENREEVILIATSHASIYARVEPLLAAGLRPMAVDTGFAALARTFSRQVRREADRDIVRAIVEIGRSGSMVLILRGDQIAFCKPISISGAQFNQAVAEHLQMDEIAAAELRAARISAVALDGRSAGPAGDPAIDRAVYEAVRPLMGEMVKEVMSCLRYYGVTFRGHPPERIILTGGEGLEPKLDEMMSKVCKLPVGFDDTAPALGGLIDGIKTSLNRTPGPAACWAVAVGLGLRGMGIAKAAKPGAGHLANRPAMRGAA